MKLLYNGKVQLYYLTDGYKSLTSMLPSLDAENFLTIVSNLFADIIAVKNNGFLSCQNIDVSSEHIFIDPSTYKISLVYLPIGKRLFYDVSAFENELRTSLIKFIQGIPSLSSPKTMHAPVPFEITITKDEFTLGRKQGLVDGVISFNRMIGRSHCRITRQGNQFAIIDLSSTNGTYVNRVRLQPEQPCPIKNGDMIRLANSEFQVIIG